MYPENCSLLQCHYSEVLRFERQLLRQIFELLLRGLVLQFWSAKSIVFFLQQAISLFFTLQDLICLFSPPYQRTHWLAVPEFQLIIRSFRGPCPLLGDVSELEHLSPYLHHVGFFFNLDNYLFSLYLRQSQIRFLLWTWWVPDLRWDVSTSMQK